MPQQAGRVFALAVVTAIALAGTQALTQPAAPTNSAPNPYRAIVGWGTLPEGRTWLERALAASSNSNERRIMALNWASFLAWNQSDLGVARARAEEALTLASTYGDERGRGWALLNLGAVTRQSGNHERATEISGQARDVFREQGERCAGRD